MRRRVTANVHVTRALSITFKFNWYSLTTGKRTEQRRHSGEFVRSWMSSGQVDGSAC